MRDFKAGDPVTFAGGKYTVERVFDDPDDSGTMRTFVVLAHNGFIVPVETLKEFSTAALKKTAEERQAEAAAQAGIKMRARADREAKRPFRLRVSKQW